MKKLQYFLLTGTLLAGLLTTINTASGAQKSWGDATGDNLWSTGGNWSPAGAPGVSDNVIFTNAGFSDLAYGDGGAVSNIVDAGFLATSINSLGYMNTNGFHNTQLINNLSVKGTSATDVARITDDGIPYVLFVGSDQWFDAGDAVVYASLLGGSLTVSNGNACLGVTQIGKIPSGPNGVHKATLDLTNLNSFTCVVSNVLVGYNYTIFDQQWRPNGDLLLAKTNSITTRNIIVSDSYQNAGNLFSRIQLGQVNTINADEIRVGMHKCVGSIGMQAGLANPSVTFRNAAGTGRQALWLFGDEYDPTGTGTIVTQNGTNYTYGYFTSNQSRGYVDLTGASVDALVDKIVLGRGQIQFNATNRTGDGDGYLIVGGGLIDVNTIEMGIQVPGPFIGGSIGRGLLVVNNDPGVGPALVLVHSNIVVAVQQPGSIDNGAAIPVEWTNAVGSQALISINDDSKVACAGDIVSPGAGGGTAIVNLNNGGTLDMKPAGDATAGNVEISILNITDAYITNYATLSLTNINMLGANATFTVYPGQAIAPARVGVIGPLSVQGSLVLRGNTLMDITKNGATLTNDTIDSQTATVDLGGTLTVTYAGPHTDLAAGDKFTLFPVAPVNSTPTVVLPPPGSGLIWVNKIFVDGSIEVAACGCGEPTTPPTITMSTSPTSIGLSWPVSYTSFVLRGQTNPLTIGLSNNWGPVPGVVGNAVTIPINPANGSVFFRLFQQ